MPALGCGRPYDPPDPRQAGCNGATPYSPDRLARPVWPDPSGVALGPPDPSGVARGPSGVARPQWPDPNGPTRLARIPLNGLH